ncbi:MAG TPA: response regulator transcription factor [Myxococcota bacterium]|nr:response regulator transcription factor [Myxococcota bacterium]
MHILVVEDDPRIAGLLERGLGEEGHRVSVAPDLATGRRLVEGLSPDLVVLDRMLGDGDGLDLARELRRRGDRRPVLVLTARDRVEERVAGLLEGADDYLVKPFSFDELLARIAALARRTLMTSPRVEVDDLVIDTEALRVWRGGEEIQLTAQEFRLLRYLAEHAGKVIPRMRLLEHVWDMHHDPGTNVVDVYISYLRAKIDKGRERPLLHTVRGLGYLLEARR